MQLGQHGGEIAAAGLDEAGRVAAQRGIRRDRALADDDRDRLVRQQLAGVAARGEARVVGEHGAGADQDRVARGALLVHALPGGGAGDPLARAVGGRGPAVEGRRPLDGDPRPAATGGGEPGCRNASTSSASTPAIDLDAGVTQALGAAAGARDRGR